MRRAYPVPVEDPEDIEAAAPSVVRPDVNVQMIGSGGFRVGATVLLTGFVLALLQTNDLLVSGLIGEASAAYVQLVLVPPAFFTYAIAGILAPPAPFFAGATLGFLSALLVTVLALLSREASSVAIDMPELAPLWVFAIVAGAAVTGGIGWTIRRVTGRS
jgi:hypothetical protein